MELLVWLLALVVCLRVTRWAGLPLLWTLGLGIMFSFVVYTSLLQLGLSLVATITASPLPAVLLTLSVVLATAYACLRGVLRNADTTRSR